jgi:hypothetical protein
MRGGRPECELFFINGTVVVRTLRAGLERDARRRLAGRQDDRWYPVFRLVIVGVIVLSGAGVLYVLTRLCWG